jgi:saccharopine dehydrogenase-like NADP-dependent oxidoreductase
MHRVLVIGAGKIGSLIGFLFAYSDDYTVYLADKHEDTPQTRHFKNLPHTHYAQLDANDPAGIIAFIKEKKIDAVVSSLPYYCNKTIAAVAAETNIHYFDLTEDVETTKAVHSTSKTAKSSFVPQCGLAPGFISIIANHLMQHFTELDTVKMRVGALPQNISNALQYSLTWSTEGLINEYGNPCYAIHGKEVTTLQPLEGLEHIEIDGLNYEAFNTSGGIGSLADSYHGKIQHLNYKTIRYPGHAEKMKFLMNDLKLNEDRDTLKRILENAIPKTLQDVVLVYVSVTGKQHGQLIEENYVKKFYPKTLHNHTFSAIQLTTATAMCTAVDLVVNNPEKYKGFVKQEQFSLDDLLNNRFGNYYA